MASILRQRRLVTQDFAEINIWRYKDTMKAKVYVTLKPGILDPQGKAIQHSVDLLGFNRIVDVRQGKYFEITLDDALAESEASEAATRMAREVLANPVIEDYRVEIEA